MGLALQCCKVCRFEQEEGSIVAFYVINMEKFQFLIITIKSSQITVGKTGNRALA